jgi:predicted small integral membrane protein
MNRIVGGAFSTLGGLMALIAIDNIRFGLFSKPLEPVPVEQVMGFWKMVVLQGLSAVLFTIGGAVLILKRQQKPAA